MEVTCFIKKEGNQYASLCVELDVASCGRTKKEALDGLKRSIETYIEYMISDYNTEELEPLLKNGLTISPIGQVLVEQSVLGWKEIEFEVMRDCVDNVIMITSMENVDAMGVHTGDSTVVAPSQTLTAKEYNTYVNYSRRIIRKVGITGGGVNIQFAGNPDKGEIVVIGGIFEHIERAGIHSGDSAMALPPYTLDKKIIQNIRENTHALAKELNVKGLMNIQYAVKDNTIYVLEVNPRASRTVPFVSKAIGVSLANLATKVMCKFSIS